MTFYLIFTLMMTWMPDYILPDKMDVSFKQQTFFNNPEVKIRSKVITGAERMSEYLPLLNGKRVALVVNHTSIVGESHLIDTLLKLGIHIGVVFAPEHGFRGEADAGEHIKDDLDPATGLPVISLYGKKKKPAPEDLQNIDMVIFDIQDVGVRFYTYISTLHYIMEACAESKVPLMVLDTPNPNAHYVDGPILDMSFKSFVGMHPVPVVYGLTIGEYARMINGEGWLEGNIQCSLNVIPCANYQHNTYYELPRKPSPNLPDMRSILLYPSTCFFEGTNLSLGRGTDYPFQWIGHPSIKSEFSFIPLPNSGAKNPPLKGKTCFGIDLSKKSLEDLRNSGSINLSYIVDMYKHWKADEEPFFLPTLFFDKLAGTDQLRLQISLGMSEKDIKASWQDGLKKFHVTRNKYIIYQD